MKIGDRLLWVGLACVMSVLCAIPCSAEELEPRRWNHLPVDTNFVGVGYGYTDADIAFDPVLKIEDATMELHTWAAKYIRTFALLNRTARVDILQAYQAGRWKGLLDGAPASITRDGLTDTILRFAVNLYGAPPLRGEEYAAYRAATETETIVGAGLSVQLPTGNYMNDKLINLGNNRFTLRPHCGALYRRGAWFAEITASVALYTDNDEFYKGNTLEQAPFYVVHGHLTRNFDRGIWAGVSLGWDYGGRSTLNGVEKNDRKQDLAWAVSAGVPVTRQVGVKLAYACTRTQERVGLDSDTFTLGLSTFW